MNNFMNLAISQGANVLNIEGAIVNNGGARSACMDTLGFGASGNLSSIFNHASNETMDYVFALETISPALFKN